MKRISALILVLALLTCAAPALAEGKLSVVQENFYAPGSGTIYGYLYAKVQNTGDAPIRIDSGTLDVFDHDGNVIANSTFITKFAEYLQPGEYTYVMFSQKVEGVETEEGIGDHTLSIETTDDVRKHSMRLSGESEFEADVTVGSFTHDYITTVCTNDKDKTVFDAVIVRALLDADGNILYIDYDNMYSSKGIMPGSSIVMHRQLNGTFEKYFEEKGIVPAGVDTLCFANVEDPAEFVGGGEAAPAEDGAPAAEPEPEAAYAALQKGSKGEDVRRLQQRLKDLGYLSGSVDGDFGKGTAGAVSAFQKAAGLAETGVADDATQKALFADDAPHA